MFIMTGLLRFTWFYRQCLEASWRIRLIAPLPAPQAIRRSTLCAVTKTSLNKLR